MTHVSEERNVEAPAEVVWRIVADSSRWPSFYHTLDHRVRCTGIELASGRDGEKGALRRVHLPPFGTWVEELARFEPLEVLGWHGVETPGVRSAKTNLELVPGKGFTTLRWDLYFDLEGVPLLSRRRKRTKRALNDLVLAALVEVDRLAMRELAHAHGRPPGRPPG